MREERISGILPHPSQQDDATGFTHSASYDEVSELTTFEIDPRYQRAWPKAKNLPFVFPHYMCTAIVKRADTASIMLSFATDPALCSLVFDVSAAEVQHVVKELFNVHIRLADGRQCVISEHGPTMEIEGSVTLKGGDSVAVDRIFGQMVGTAFRYSPQRMNELSMGEMLSKSVSMKVSAMADRPGRLNFMVDAEQLGLIYERLWPA